MVAALTALYMGHCKVLERVRPFIEAGGLLSLVALIDHPNLHIASQAMNSLLLITDGAGAGEDGVSWVAIIKSKQIS